MNFDLNTAQQVITLLTGLIGLISTAIATFFAIKNFIANIKTKNSQEIWALLMNIADAAMKEAEASALMGAEKKDFALRIINSSCEAAGLDISEFVGQLDTYIEDTVKFYNDMKSQNQIAKNNFSEQK
jgi:hypothetical protein